MHNKDTTGAGSDSSGSMDARKVGGQGSPETLTLDELMRRVRAEVLRRREDAAALSEREIAGEAGEEDRSMPRWVAPSARLEVKQAYTIHELLQLSDADFIDGAYRILLRRPADAQGFEHFLSGIRSGVMSKIEVLGQIRFSEEGRRRGVHVDGLLIPYKLHSMRRLPIIGRVISLAMAFARLPRLAKRMDIVESRLAADIHQLGRLFNAQASQMGRRLDSTDNLLCELNESTDALLRELSEVRAGIGVMEGRLDELDVAMDSHRIQLEDVRAMLTPTRAALWALRGIDAEWYGRLVDGLDERRRAIAELDSERHKSQRKLLDLQRRVMALTDDIGQQTVVSATAIGDDMNDDVLNEQYVSFEDSFRGTREDIKQRSAEYLSLFDDTSIRSDGGLVLDLGCGRGEWLEVLTEHGYTCRGVDLNDVMLGEAASRGLDVAEADALTYLRGLQSDSVAAITSMHLVEHLPHGVLVRLLNEAWRVLRTGGIIVLETPNPENITVGSCWFYLDPTHRNPIPPALLQWLVGERGFEDVQIKRLSEHRGVMDIATVPEGVPGSAQINQLAALITAAPDYAVIAVKR